MADKGGSGGLEPPFLADIFCEQPLYNDYREKWGEYMFTEVLLHHKITRVAKNEFYKFCKT